MRMRLFAAAVTCAVLCASGAKAADQCRIQQLPAFHVTMNGLRPLVQAKINGADATFIIDSGAFMSLLSPAAAAHYRLPTDPAGPQFYITGANGDVRPRIASVETFSLLHVNIHHVVFLVGGNDFGSGAAGVLGANVLHLADMEYDLAHGVMRFIAAEHCRGPQLAYWASDQAVSTVKLQRADDLAPQLTGTVELNGHEITADFDTGTPRSMLSVSAAKRAGIGPGAPGVVAAGYTSGIARSLIKVWIAPVAVLQIGSEKIEHTHILVGAFTGIDTDLLLGSDFFLSHHVYVSKDDSRLYFTYNGGPVFDLGRAGSSAKPAAADGAAQPAAGPPLTASALLRRGMAEAARMQYAPALIDVKRACQLDPRNAPCLTERGKLYWALGQAKQALADFDAALALQPDEVDAHRLRAELQLTPWARSAGSATSTLDDAIQADLSALDRLLTPQAQGRLQLALLYDRLGRYAEGIEQVDTWIRFHAEDTDLPLAWNERCWMRAESDQDLESALKDCNRAIKAYPPTADFLDSRGLVELRLGRFHRARADYDGALRLDPRMATALYGRAVAEQRLGYGSAGSADVAAAAKVDPGVAAQFGKWGITP